MGCGPCDFGVSPSPFGLDFGTLDFGTSDLGLTIVEVAIDSDLSIFENLIIRSKKETLAT